MREVLGVEPGAVTPFGAINDTRGRVTVVLDAAMMEHATLNYHPLVNTMTTSIARDDLVKFLESTGHLPRIERVSGRAAGGRLTRLQSPRRMTHLIGHGTGFRPVAVRGAIKREEHMLQNGGGMTAAADSAVKDTTTQGFVKDVIEESKRQPVLVDFWAPWCGPCKQLTPILEKVVKAAKGKVKLVKMDIDKHPEIPGQMGIQSIPAVIAFVNGQPVDGFMGALPESQVIGLPRAADQGQDRRRGQGSAEGRRRGARRRQCRRRRRSLCGRCWRRTAATSPRSPASRAAMSRPAISSRRSRRSAMVPEAKRNDAAVAAARAALELAEQAKSVGPVDELEQKVAANPLDHQARFDLAVALNAAGKRAEAVDHLLEIVKRDRKWNDDGARKQLVQFFEAWGPTDEATVDGRKRLSSILFS